MARPIKCRLIESEPSVALFKPCGVPTRLLETNRLTFEELEALRLKDLEGLDQSSAASRMNVSRPTFQRILRSAQVKISDALVNGKAIHIEGGTYSLADNVLNCTGCGHKWRADTASACPKCACRDIQRFVPGHQRCKTGRCGHKHKEHHEEVER